MKEIMRRDVLQGLLGLGMGVIACQAEKQPVVQVIKALTSTPTPEKPTTKPTIISTTQPTLERKKTPIDYIAPEKTFEPSLEVLSEAGGETPEATSSPTKSPTATPVPPTETQEPTKTSTPEPTLPIPEVTKPMSFKVNFDPEVSPEIREKVYLTEAGEVRLKEAFYHALSGPFFQGKYGKTPEEVATFLENNNWIIKDFRYPINAGKGAWGETTISEPAELNLREGIILNFVAHAPEHKTGIGLYQTGGRGIGFEMGLADGGRLIITVYNSFLRDEGLKDLANWGYDNPVEHELKRTEGTILVVLNILANHDENPLESSPDPDRYLNSEDLFRVIVNAIRATRGSEPASRGEEVDETMRILEERRGGLILIPYPYSLAEGVFSIRENQ